MVASVVLWSEGMSSQDPILSYLVLRFWRETVLEHSKDLWQNENAILEKTLECPTASKEVNEVTVAIQTQAHKTE